MKEHYSELVSDGDSEHRNKNAHNPSISIDKDTCGTEDIRQHERRKMTLE